MVRAAVLQVEKDKQVVLEDNQIVDIIAKESSLVNPFFENFFDILAYFFEKRRNSYNIRHL